MDDSAPNAPPEDLWARFMAYADGRLDVDEVRRLEQELANDAALRRHYLLFSEMHMQLAWRHRALESVAARAAEWRQSLAVALAAAASRWRRHWETVRGAISHPTPLSLIVAALFMTSVVLSLVLWTMPQLVAPNQGGDVVAATYVARILRTHEAVWASDSSLEQDADLWLGQRVTLRAGLAELQFDSGAVLLLQAPATIIPRGKNHCELLSGDLTARVPTSAVGFTVDVPLARVVDLGTEFAVGAQPDHSADFYVFDGEIELQPRTASGGQNAAPRRALSAGESFSIDGQGRTRHASAQEFMARFRRVAPGQPLDPRATQRVVFQQGLPDPFTGQPYVGCDDAMLIAWAPNSNFGGREDFDVGGQEPGKVGNTLIRFDLSSLRGRFDSIRHITLRLTTSDRDYNPAGAGAVQVHRLHDRYADWRPGRGASASDAESQAAGVVTWSHFAGPDAPWQGAAGASQSGVDHWPQAYAARTYSATQPQDATFDLKLTGDFAFAEAWANGQPNAGFLLKNRFEHRTNRINFYSSEHPNPNFRPQLIVEYVPAGVEAAPVNETSSDAARAPQSGAAVP